MQRLPFVIALVLALSGAGLFLLPQAWQSWRLVTAADDPAALAQVRTESALTPTRLAAEVDAAIAAADTDLAESFVALGAERGLSVDAARLARIEALKAGALQRAAADFGLGFIAGARESDAGFAGALVADVVGVGDLRDLAAEGRKWLGGEPTDPALVMLAAAGLGLTAATVASLGSAMPARNGLSLVKAASRAKLVSPALGAQLTRVAVSALDRPALQATMSAAGRLDLTAARAAAGGIVRPAALARLSTIGQDAARLHATVGQRGLRQALAVADDSADIARAARLAAAKPATMRATLTLLGRGALVLGAAALTAAGWLLTLLGWALALAMLAQRLGWWLGRLLIPAPRRLA